MTMKDLHIFAELVLTAATLFLGGVWWQLRKRAKFLRQTIANQLYLDAVISKETLVSPPSRIERYLQKNSVGYFVNIDVVIQADHSSQWVFKIASSICLLLILGTSLYLGYVYLAINLSLLLLLGFLPITESTKRNALEQIVTLAVILYRWRTENSVECDNWVAQVRSLQKLYGAVQKTSEISR